jgi:phage head maturation protease
MNELDFALDTKSLNDDGQIEGLAAGYGNVDFGGDVMLPGSISKSLQNKSRIRCLWLTITSARSVSGRISRRIATDCSSKGRFAMSTVAGKEAHALVKDGAIGGLSVGLHNVKRRIVGKARHIVEAHASRNLARYRSDERTNADFECQRHSGRWRTAHRSTV